jgi:hypothetical protein
MWGAIWHPSSHLSCILYTVLWGEEFGHTSIQSPALPLLVSHYLGYHSSISISVKSDDTFSQSHWED